MDIMVKYDLKLKTRRVPKFVLTLEGDVCDGDIIESQTVFRESRKDEMFPLIKELQDNFLNKSHAIEDLDYDDDADIFEEINLPYSEGDGYCHTLTFLSLEYYDIDGKIYDVILKDE